MPRKLIECIPNFSEGRRPEVVEAIAGAVVAVPGVIVLDRHLDASHNRSVLTFAGEPEAVKDAAFRAVEKATHLIDITKHRGVHPRIGATDVIPIVPLRSTTMVECVHLAGALGEEIVSRLGIPVYFYEEAARRPERKILANIRRGEFEALAVEIGVKPERAPDLGPARVHPTAGAIAIGARNFLIAFNVNLATTDHELAKSIANKIREAGGGFVAVRALGLKLEEEGIVQVSMNLVDYNKTGLAEVFRRISELARERGVEVRGSEIVGLVPEAAVHAAARDALGIIKLDRHQIIEERLRDLIAGPIDFHEFLDDLASTAPTPGGGSAAALAGTLGAAATEKVLNLSRARQKPPEEFDFDTPARDVHAARWDLLRLVECDAAAFDSIIAASRLPRATPEENARRTRAIQAATLDACRTPLAIAEAALRIARAAALAAEHGSRLTMADAVAAAAFARAAADGAFAMFRVNQPGLDEAALAADLAARFETIRREIDLSVRTAGECFDASLAKKPGPKAEAH